MRAGTGEERKREKEDEGMVKNGEEEKEKVVVVKKVKEGEIVMEVIVGSRGEDREDRGSSSGEDSYEEIKRWEMERNAWKKTSVTINKSNTISVLLH